MADIDETKAHLQTHEQVCALRYAGICSRLKRLESVGLTVAGAIIVLLINIVMKVG